MKTGKIITMLMTASLLISTVSAQPVSKSIPGEPLSVKYIGADDDYITFEVTIATGDIKHAVLHIDDASAGSLYAETLESNSKVEKIKIEKKDSQNISFELIAGKKTYLKSFLINTSVIEKTTVLEGNIVTRY